VDNFSKKKYFPHVPVLKNEVIAYLIVNPSGTYVDGTLGSGGHTESILKALTPDGKVVGMDRDPEAIAYCRERFSNDLNRIQLIHGEFGRVDEILDDLRVSAVDGFLLDLGVSNHQLICGTRGFSYQQSGPLDMRMNPSEQETAKDIVNRYSEKDLADIFYRYGEERHSRRIAREIVRYRKKESIKTTGMLADIVRQVTPPRWQIKTLSRIFQSVRIVLNREIDQLINGLIQITRFLKPSGRILCISYHSLEDRIVKRYFKGTFFDEHPEFKDLKVPNVSFKMLTKKVIRPDSDEIRQNPKSRAARLRSAELVKYV
jgi:16S rRNA (cytosine1402-N4)-methyltransferase